jgi:hypothetical protein
MSFSDLMDRFWQKKTKFKEMEDDIRMQKLINQKQKSSNERELERFLEEERQKQIKIQLDGFRKKRTRELFSGGMLKSKSVFNHKPTVLKSGNIMTNGKNMLEKGNIL